MITCWKCNREPDGEVVWTRRVSGRTKSRPACKYHLTLIRIAVWERVAASWLIWRFNITEENVSNIIDVIQQLVYVLALVLLAQVLGRLQGIFQ